MQDDSLAMRIAQVAPLFERVPPETYGGTERVVSNLTDMLVELGHQVTLFASGDSQTSGELIPVRPRAMRLDKHCQDPLVDHLVMFDSVAAMARAFDVIHFHTGYLHFPVARYLQVPHVTTMHGRLDLPDLGGLFDRFRDVPVVSISNRQREPVPQAAWQRTVYHGLPTDLLPFGEPGADDYLVFLGRIAPEKRPDRAIEIARAAGVPLKIAAKVDRVDEAYFAQVIKPLLAGGGVEYLGEVSEDQKGPLLSGARALLFPIDWPEPFGMVLIEALSCGTPVISWNHGSVPELIDHGRTGFIVSTVAEAVDAVACVVNLDRWACRRTFEDRFTADRMARDYLAVYDTLLTRAADYPREEGQRERSRRGSEPVVHRRSYGTAGRQNPRSEAG
jgi:glycosyltransferase involved in cell wall biosynthesis